MGLSVEVRFGEDVCEVVLKLILTNLAVGRAGSGHLHPLLSSTCAHWTDIDLAPPNAFFKLRLFEGQIFAVVLLR